MKTILYITIAVMLIGIASASVGEVAGFLYFNFTKTNQTLTNTWTLVNTGNSSVSFNVILPSHNASLFTIKTNVLNGTIPANSYLPIKVSVTVLSPVSFNGMLSALFKGSGNIDLQIAKQIYVNFGHPSTTSGTSITTTSLITTVPPTTITSPATPLAQPNVTTQSTTMPPTTILTPQVNAQSSSTESGSAPNNSVSGIVLAVGIGTAIVIGIVLGIAFSKRGSGKANSGKAKRHRATRRRKNVKR